MKTFNFMLDQFQLAMISSSFRKKEDVVLFWINAIKIMQTYSSPSQEDVVGELVIHVDKMSRLFLSSEGKCVSVSFPFSTHVNSGLLSFVSKACGDVDSRVSSGVISLLSKNIFLSEDVFEFIDPILEVCDFDPRAWVLLRDLIMADDGYIRFDHDPARKNGHLHPLNHLDVFYTHASTFKVGVQDKVAVDDFIDILSNKTNCHYLNRA